MTTRKNTLGLLKRTLKLVAPPAPITVDEWADANRVLSPESAANPGPWKTSKSPHQREPMRAISDPNIESIVLMWGSQLGKTEVQLNAIGYYTGHDPAPIMAIQPDLGVAKDFSNDRVAPMYRDSPQLSQLVTTEKSRNSRNTILYKTYPGGRINIAGANAPASLASKPIRVVIGDEVDRFPASAGKEGDPVSLVTKRTNTFHNKKLIWVSTPTIKGASRIESLYEDSTMEQLHLPCPHCNEHQVLQWPRIVYEYDKETKECKSVEHRCEYCGMTANEYEWKKDYEQKSKWVAQRQHATTRGFQLSSLYATIGYTWKNIVIDWYKAQRGGAETLKTFINTVLAESWEEKGEQLDDDLLYNRREIYQADVPEGVKLLTAAVDTQNNRFEVEVQGWGAGFENWRIEYHVIYGDLKQPKIWKDLDEYLKRTWTDIEGNRFGIVCTCMDSGGHFTNEVYQFTKARLARNIFAIKGESAGDGTYKPLIIGTSNTNRYKATVIRLGVDEGKAKVVDALKAPMVDELGDKMPGYVHFPATTPERNRGYERDYFDGLTAESLQERKKLGKTFYVWIKNKPRNEPFDLAVYNRAAIEWVRADLDMMEPYCTKAQKEQLSYTTATVSTQQRRRRGSKGL